MRNSSPAHDFMGYAFGMEAQCKSWSLACFYGLKISLDMFLEWKLSTWHAGHPMGLAIALHQLCAVLHGICWSNIAGIFDKAYCYSYALHWVSSRARFNILEQNIGLARKGRRTIHNKRLQSHASISSHKHIAKLFNKHLLCWGNCRFDTLAQSHASIS